MSKVQIDLKKSQLVILYGSQTGNAQDLAERTWRQAKQLNLNSLLSSMNDYDLNRLSEDDIILFICSTTGQGDVADNMTQFWKAIMRKSLPFNCLENLCFFLLGLGDSNYPKFNFVAKKLFRRLVQLGATPLADACLCDDQNSDGYEGTYFNWIKNLWETLNVSYNEITRSSEPYPHIYQVNFIEETNSPANMEDYELATESRPFYAKVVKNERMTSENHFQNVRMIEFDCQNTKRIEYEAGDVLMIQPNNLDRLKTKFLELFSHLNLNLQQKIEVKCNFPNEIIDKELKLNRIKTVDDLFQFYFDYNSIPRMTFFELFSRYATNELEKEKLQEFLSREGREDLYDYCYRPRRTILEIFADFPLTTQNVKKLEDLLNLVPGLKPRAFSIASSPTLHKEKIQLLVAVVEYKTRMYEKRVGTCSNWLASIEVNNNVFAPIWIKKGSFNVNWTNPIICIGPGTGVAPFRSMINERINKYKNFNNYLYFGCRSKTADFYFQHEWSDLTNSDMLKLHTAFSRDQENKIYVQDELLNSSEMVFELIDKQGAYIYIAGNSKRMPDDVIETLKLIIQRHAVGVDDKKAYSDNFIKNLETNRRIQLETWS